MSIGYLSRHRQHQSTVPSLGLRYIIRIWGIFTAIVTYALGAVSQLQGHGNAGLLIVIFSFLILILEMKWLIRLLLLQCNRNSNNRNDCVWKSCSTFGRVCGGWHLSFPYVTLGIAFLIWSQALWLSFVAGCLLIILSVLRLLTVIRCQSSMQKENLLPQYDFEKIIDGMNEGDHQMPGDYLKVSIGPSLESIEPLDEIC